MERLILGTAGHIDHGKTTLVRALTGVDTDRLPEEKRRGITIDLGFAALDLPDGTHYGIVDVPGHEAFVRNMLAGATGVDVALLVVAADEGVMPQTREHAAILELLAVPSLVVALTKIDTVDDAWRELATDDVRALLAASAWPDAPIVAVSGATGEGLDALRAALGSAARAARERREDDLFRMPVDRVFTVHGTGTVVTGTVWSGRVQRDDQLLLVPSGRSVRVRGVQTHGVDAPSARAGERAALALVGVDRDAVARGETLTSARAWQPSERLTVRLAVLPSAAHPMRTRQRVRLHLGTAEVMARLAVLDGNEIAPGEAGWARLRLERPIAARTRDRLVIRSYSPITTIAGGIVAEPDAPRRARLRAGETAALDALLDADPGRALAARASLDGWAGSARSALPIVTGWPPSVLERTMPQAVHGALTRVFSAATVDTARDRIRAALDEWHARNPIEEGCDRDALRRSLPADAHAELLHAALDSLERAGAITVSGATYARTGWSPVLSAASEAHVARLREELLAAGLESRASEDLSPPLAAHPDTSALLRFLERRGELVAIAPGRYVNGAALRAGIAAAHQRLGGREPLAPPDFRDVWGISRKHLIPLLEYLDRTGTTERAGDGRRLRALETTSGIQP